MPDADHILTVVLSEREHTELTLTGELMTQLGFVRLRIALDTPTDITVTEPVPAHEETAEQIKEHGERLGNAKNLAGRLYPLLAAGYLKVNEILFYTIEKTGASYGLMINSDGELVTSDGRVFEFPSPAAGHARQIESGESVHTSDGWLILRNSEGARLHDMREESGLWLTQENPTRRSYLLREDWAERAVKLRANQAH